jgi:hypothetical protein
VVVVRSADWGISPVGSSNSRASLTGTVADFADAQNMQRHPIDQPRNVPCGGASGIGWSAVTGRPSGSGWWIGSSSSSRHPDRQGQRATQDAAERDQVRVSVLGCEPVDQAVAQVHDVHSAPLAVFLTPVL